jgi:hypothetical protein
MDSLRGTVRRGDRKCASAPQLLSPLRHRCRDSERCRVGRICGAHHPGQKCRITQRARRRWHTKHKGGKPRWPSGRHEPLASQAEAMGAWKLRPRENVHAERVGLTFSLLDKQSAGGAYHSARLRRDWQRVAAAAHRPHSAQTSTVSERGSRAPFGGSERVQPCSIRRELSPLSSVTTFWHTAVPARATHPRSPKQM